MHWKHGGGIVWKQSWFYFKPKQNAEIVKFPMFWKLWAFCCCLGIAKGLIQWCCIILLEDIFIHHVFLKHSSYYMKIYTIIINLVEHKNNNQRKQNVLQYQKEKFCLIKFKVAKQKKLSFHLDFFVSIFIQIDIYLQSIFVFMKVHFSSRKYSIGMSHLQFFPLLGSWSTFRSTRNAGSTFIFRLWSL